MNVLIIEDKKDIAANLHDYLESRGHHADAAADGVTGLHLAVVNEYDVILLDLGLPGMDGLTVCKKLREDAKRDTPVLMLTARDTLENKLDGFAHGADDYMVKPFALREVEARLVALDKRRKGRFNKSSTKIGALTFNPSALTLERAGVAIKLPPKCLRILELMMENPNKVFRRNEIESAVWGDSLPNSETLRSHMYQLRRALANPGEPDIIETVHGIGYRLVNKNI